jgi:hypothetical protein
VLRLPALTAPLAVRVAVVAEVATRVGMVMVPVKTVGPARLAFNAKAAVAAVDRGLSASEVFETLLNPTIAFVTPPTVPVKLGDASGARRLSAVST